jgi:hypothetical protein
VPVKVVQFVDKIVEVPVEKIIIKEVEKFIEVPNGKQHNSAPPT